MNKYCPPNTKQTRRPLHLLLSPSFFYGLTCVRKFIVRKVIKEMGMVGGGGGGEGAFQLLADCRIDKTCLPLSSQSLQTETYKNTFAKLFSYRFSTDASPKQRQISIHFRIFFIISVFGHQLKKKDVFRE